MKHIIPFTIALLPALALLPACDSPEDEAELAALDVEQDVEDDAADIQGAPASGAERDIVNHSPDPVAAQPNQLCRVDSAAPAIVLYTSATSGIYVPPNSLVRILDYRGPYHYLARYDGTVGQLERSRVVQSTCYFQ